MAQVTLRSTKGSALTHAEMDENLSNLSNATPVSVKEFGAVGDGVTDDTAAIQAAIDTGLHVYFGDSTESYLVSNTLTITTLGQRLFADNAVITQSTDYKTIFHVENDYVEINGFHLIQTGKGNETALTLPNSYGAGVTVWGRAYCRILNNFIENAGNNSFTEVEAGAAVWLSGCSYCLVENNKIINSHIGVNSDAYKSGSLSRKNTIRKNRFDDCRSGVVDDLQGPNTASNIGDTITDNVFIKVRFAGVIMDFSRYGIVIGNYIEGVRGDSNYMGYGVVVVHNSLWTKIIGNEIINCGISGVVLDQSGGYLIQRVVVADNIIRYCVSDGIRLYTVEGLTISNNILTDNDGYGIININGSYPRVLRIQGNDINKNGKAGIHLADAQAIVITENTITLNSQLGSGTYSGIEIQKRSVKIVNVIISDNIFQNPTAGVGPELQSYCFSITANSGTPDHENVIFSNNISTGQVNGAVYDTEGLTRQVNNSLSTWGVLTESSTNTTLSAENGIYRVNLGQTAPTTITEMTGGFEGQYVTLAAYNDYTTLQHGTGIGSFKLRNGLNAKIKDKSTLTVMYRNGTWVEISRSFDTFNVVTWNTVGASQEIDVTNYSLLDLNPASTSSFISFTGTVFDGKTLYVRSYSDYSTIKHNDSGATYKILMASGRDEVLQKSRMYTFVFNNSQWVEVANHLVNHVMTYTTTGANQSVSTTGFGVVHFNQSSASNVIEFTSSTLKGGEVLYVRAFTANTTLTHNSGSATYPILLATGADVNLSVSKVYAFLFANNQWTQIIGT